MTIEQGLVLETMTAFRGVDMITVTRSVTTLALGNKVHLGLHCYYFQGKRNKIIEWLKANSAKQFVIDSKYEEHRHLSDYERRQMQYDDPGDSSFTTAELEKKRRENAGKKPSVATLVIREIGILEGAGRQLVTNIRTLAVGGAFPENLGSTPNRVEVGRFVGNRIADAQTFGETTMNAKKPNRLQRLQEKIFSPTVKVSVGCDLGEKGGAGRLITTRSQELTCGRLAEYLSGEMSHQARHEIERDTPAGIR